MECVSIGPANPDIAGIGILVAFVTQSLIAVIVSFYTFILNLVIQQRWKASDPDPFPRLTLRGIGSTFHLSGLRIPSLLSYWIVQLSRRKEKFDELMRLIFQVEPPEPLISPRVLAKLEWLVGAQPKHARQRREAERIGDEVTATTKRLDFANRILLAGNDSQTFTGIALLISALVQSQTLSLYHMHIIYDTISLVVISNCAASVCIFSQGRLKGFFRVFLIGTWTILFIAYFSVFAVQLQTWDNTIPLHCYDTKALSLPSRPHPYMDNIYIVITFFTAFGSIGLAQNLALASLAHEELLKWDPAKTKLMARLEKKRPLIIQMYKWGLLVLDKMTSLWQISLVQIALLQCPVHIWSIFTLRLANNDRLDSGGGREQEWGFGQIVAMVLLGATLFPIVDGLTGYGEDEAKKGNTTRSGGQQTEDVEHMAAESIGVIETNTPRPSVSGVAEPRLDQHSEPFDNTNPDSDQQAEPLEITPATSIHGAEPTTPPASPHDPSAPSDSSQPVPSAPSLPAEQTTHISGALKSSDPEHKVTENASREEISRT